MQTKTRRLLQPIWNIFDANFSPLSQAGLLLCVSGGSDSRALLEAAAQWPKRFERIFVVSVDHGTRPETAFEAQSVASRARVLGFESYVLTLGQLDKKDEASLRGQRYAAIWQLAFELGVKVIATAHTEDDQAESFVMDLMGLGGGPEGAGMQVVTCLGEKNLLRPLLPFSRAYLIAVLTELHVYDYFVDPTNEQSEANRTGVRNFLKLHKAPKTRLAELANRRRQDMQALQTLARDLVAFEGSQVKVSLKTGMPESIRLQALKIALAELMPGEDLRNAHKTLAKVSEIPGKGYDLPGCRLEVHEHEMVVTRAVSESVELL